jgi:uncharacterized protein (TIGR01244 family)
VTIRFLLPVTAVLVGAGAGLACQAAPTAERQATTAAPGDRLPGTVNYSRVDATVACGGATSIEALPHLRDQGFNAVINLREASERGADIDESRQAAEKVGLRYVHIPMSGKDPAPETADAFLRAVTDPANSPVYIHCGSANRVGAMWLIKRVVDDGWDVDRATQEAERIGLKSPELKQFALDYIQTRQG